MLATMRPGPGVGRCDGTQEIRSWVCMQVLMANERPAERYKVVYKRPTDLALGQDVPICCNIVLCDMLDEGASLQAALVLPCICLHMWTAPMR